MFRIKKVYLTYLLIIVSTICTAQSYRIDSLLEILDKQQGVERMKTLRDLSKTYLNNSVEDAIKYANELLMLAEKEGNLKYLDGAYSFLGEAYFYRDDIDRSIKYFEKFLETNIQQKDIDGIATAYNNLGIVYRYIENYETSIQYYLESLAIKEKLKDTTGISNTLNNIGVLYFHMENYTNALNYYSRSYELELKVDNKSGIATSLLNIGEVYSYLTQYKEALSRFEQSIQIAKKNDDMHTLEVNYKCLYEMYKRKVDFQKALYYHEMYTELRNDRLSQESRKEIAELEIQYETKQKEKEIELLNKQNHLNRIIILILSISFLVFIFLIVLLIKQGKAKKIALKMLSGKNEQITLQSEDLNKLNNTKDKFFSIISHDLKGMIGGFNTQTEFLADDFNNLEQKDIHDQIVRINQSSKNLYALLENLLEWSKTQTGSIKVQPEKFNLKNSIEDILRLFSEQMSDKKVMGKVKIDSEINVFADKNMVNTILRNLITNAIKFSYPDSEFTISAVNKNELVQIEVMDQGTGISSKNLERLFRIDQSFSNRGTHEERGSGLGLLICKEFVELNEGKIWVESKAEDRSANINGGSKFIFTLKKA